MQLVLTCQANEMKNRKKKINMSYLKNLEKYSIGKILSIQDNVIIELDLKMLL